jgi:uncharacterized protein YecT (DUF1311 family)
MTQVDLSALSDGELRQMLDTARNRGQASQSYVILQEMADRRQRREQRAPRQVFRRRRPAHEPRVIALDLGDPLEKHDALDPDPLPPWPADRDSDDIGAITLDREPVRPPPPPQRPRTRRTPWMALGFAGGAVVGVVVGLGVAEVTFRPPAPAEPAPIVAAAAPPAPPATLQIAMAEPQAPLDVTPEIVAEPALAGEGDVPSPDAAEGLPVETAAAEPAPESAPTEEEPSPPTAAKIELARSETAPSAACAGAATPADRAICEDERLQRLQVELRQAYAKALEAHADRALLRQRQLAWRDARNAVAEPERLAQLYSDRIRKLNAATAEALRQR